jgi:hypothetical protein
MVRSATIITPFGGGFSSTDTPLRGWLLMGRWVTIITPFGGGFSSADTPLCGGLFLVRSATIVTPFGGGFSSTDEPQCGGCFGFTRQPPINHSVGGSPPPTHHYVVGPYGARWRCVMACSFTASLTHSTVKTALSYHVSLCPPAARPKKDRGAFFLMKKANETRPHQNRPTVARPPLVMPKPRQQSAYGLTRW